MLLVLGAMHFVNLFVFYRLRHHARVATLPPRVAPQAYAPAQPQWQAPQ